MVAAHQPAQQRPAAAVILRVGRARQRLRVAQRRPAVFRVQPVSLRIRLCGRTGVAQRHAGAAQHNPALSVAGVALQARAQPQRQQRHLFLIQRLRRRVQSPVQQPGRLRRRLLPGPHLRITAGQGVAAGAHRQRDDGPRHVYAPPGTRAGNRAVRRQRLPAQAHPPARAGDDYPAARHDGGQRQHPQQHRQRGQRRVVGDEVAVARHHITDNLLIAFSFLHQVIHLPAHVGGYHRVRVRNAVVLAFRTAQLLREPAELLLLRLILKRHHINGRQR
ncbi:hypothetical protein D088_160001 [Salmonella enterica subsp. houtenae serovar 16:z4,z32:-- str. RKS3027]|nr:hypothetical protein D088_160001 [Salmonella enterica subsp. houtenae serovar 16:z4,z32:-- str. RKS3027]